MLYDGGAACGLRLAATTDGGNHFELRTPPAERPQGGPAVSRLVFSSENRGWAFGRSFVTTKDGGRSWVTEPTAGVVVDVGARAQTVARLDRRCQSRGRCSVTLFTSTDDGAHWYKRPLGAAASDAQVMVLDRGHVVLRLGRQLHVSASPRGPFRRRTMPCSAKGGASAQTVGGRALDDLWAVCAHRRLTRQRGLTVFRSRDGGRSWHSPMSRIPTGSGKLRPGPVGRLVVADSRRAFLARPLAPLAATFDGGRHWVEPLRQLDPTFGLAVQPAWATATPGRLVVAASGNLGAYRSLDRGRHWRSLPPVAPHVSTRSRSERELLRDARGYLRALRSENGERICHYLTPEARRELAPAARHSSGCAARASHDFHELGRVVGAFPIVALEVNSPNRATVVIGDALISDSGDDNFEMRRLGRRWKVVNL